MAKILVLLAFALNITHAFANTTVCDDGDYHLTISGEKGSSTLSYRVCEFGECNGDLDQTGPLISENVYDISSATEKQTLRVSFGANGKVSEASITDDGYVI